MSLFTSFRRAFGIGDEYDDDDLQDTEDEVQEPIDKPTDTKSREQAPMLHEGEKDSLASEIMAGVIEIFNSTQPDFVKNCLDTEAQKKYLYESLEKSLRAKIERAVSTGYQEGLKKWEEEKQVLSNEIEKLKSEKNNFEQRRNESKGALLSAERQKRALTERVRDLETQLAKTEAENEQLSLENRSMLNKIRVAGIRGNGLTDDDNSLSEELTKLQETLDNLNKEKEALITKTDEEIARLTSENANLSKLLDEAKSFSTNTSVKDTEIEKLQAELKRLESESENIAKEKKNATASQEKATARIKELEKELEAAAYIKEQVDKIEETLAKKEAKIESIRQSEKAHIKKSSELEKELERKNKEIAELNKEISNLKTTITQNLEALKEFDNIKKPFSIKEEKQSDEIRIEEQSLTLREPSRTEHAPSRKKRGRHSTQKDNTEEISPETKTKQTPIISAIDELLDSNDWFVAPDLSDLTKGAKEAEDPEDFGYKPPQRKTNTDFDDKQLSLW